MMAISAIRRCKSCRAPIRWVRSAKNGKPVPLNPAQFLIVDEEGHAHRGYVPHWATCPHADEHRRRQSMGCSFLTPQQQAEQDRAAAGDVEVKPEVDLPPE